MSWITRLIGLDDARTAQLSAQPLEPSPATIGYAQDVVHPAASLYRASVVAQQVVLSIPSVRKARAEIAGTASTFKLAAWSGATRLDAGDPRASWLRQPDPLRTLQWQLFKTIDDGLWWDRCLWEITGRTIVGDFGTRYKRVHPSRVQTIDDPHDPDTVATWIVDGISYSPADARRRFLVFDFAGMGGLRRFGAPLLQLYADLQASAGNYAIAPTPKEILKNNGPDLDDDEIDALLASWEAQRATHSTAYLNAALDHDTVGFSPKDLQLVESREHSALEVARLFGLPAWCIDATGGSSETYANIVDRRRDKYAAIQPWLTVIEQTLSMDDRSARPTGLALPLGIVARFDADDYLRESAQDRMNTWAVAKSNELLTDDEIRDLEPLARSARA